MSLTDEFLNEFEILGLWVRTITVNMTCTVHMICTILNFNLSELIEFEGIYVDGCTLPMVRTMLLSLLCVL